MTAHAGLIARGLPEPAAGTRYRPDIDGLRAIAVLPVVFYHFGVPLFSGGYVGVDVFFVISGYLITSLIHTEMTEHRFSVIAFYERRIRRIFPALFAVLAATTAAGLVILFPDQLVRFAGTLPATAGFASNFAFVHKAGYFDVAASQKPLLHTWSLAVEEQFYLLFPGLLYLLKGTERRRLVAIFCAIFVLSLAASIWGIRHSPVSTFFLLPFRFWELLAGAILAVGRFRAPPHAAIRNAVSLAGFGLVVGSVLAFTTVTPFPGENALPPCLGAALIIYAGEERQTGMNALLATQPLVAIGLISYSLYLWHWPIFVFAKAYALTPLGAPETFVLIALSFGLAFLSWKYVELPFRGRVGILSRRNIFVLAGTAIIVTSVVGEAILYTDGFPRRYDARIRAILAEVSDQEARVKECAGISVKQIARNGLCGIGRDRSRPSFILWGDSHADAVLPAVDAAARQTGTAGLFASQSACAPLLGIAQVNARHCAAFNNAVLKIVRSSDIRLVFLAARWATYTDPALYDPDDQKVVLSEDNSRAASAEEMTVMLAHGLKRMVAALVAARKTVVILASVPETRVVVPQTLARSILTGQQIDIEPSVTEYRARQKASFDVFNSLHTQYGVNVLYPERILCGHGRCAVARDGIPLYRDGTHLSVYGARLLEPLFVPVLTEFKPHDRTVIPPLEMTSRPLMSKHRN